MATLYGNLSTDWLYDVWMTWIASAESDYTPTAADYAAWAADYTAELLADAENEYTAEQIADALDALRRRLDY